MLGNVAGVKHLEVVFRPDGKEVKFILIVYTDVEMDETQPGYDAARAAAIRDAVAAHLRDHPTIDAAEFSKAQS
jgi:hypothetical protein